MNVYTKYKSKLSKIYNIKEIVSLIFTVFVIIIIIILIKESKLHQYFNIKNIKALRNLIEDYGIKGQLIYISLNILCALLAIPTLPVKFLGGLVYGPIIGTILTETSSIIATTLCFIISRYLIGRKIEMIFSKSQRFNKIYSGVEDSSWKMIMITRLIPFFPYSLQNYGYGITNINIKTYILATSIFMIPSNFAICYLASSIGNNENLIFALILYIFMLVFFTSLGIIIKTHWAKK